MPLLRLQGSGEGLQGTFGEIFQISEVRTLSLDWVTKMREPDPPTPTIQLSSSVEEKANLAS